MGRDATIFVVQELDAANRVAGPVRNLMSLRNLVHAACPARALNKFTAVAPPECEGVPWYGAPKPAAIFKYRAAISRLCESNTVSSWSLFSP
jgi:hypothetical protein